MAQGSAVIEQRIDCPCGGYHWREVIAVAAIGVVAFDRKCRRCSRWYLIALRVSVGARPTARVIAKVPKDGRREADFRRALGEIPGLTSDEAEFLLAVAHSLADQQERAAV